MSDATDLTAMERRVLDAVSRAARAGELCPSNHQLADLLGMASPAAGSETLGRLEKRGLIRVERFQAARRVTILGTGERTAMPASCRPHWRTAPPPAGHPTGAQMVDQLAAAAAERGQPLHRFAQPLHGETSSPGCARWARPAGPSPKPWPASAP